jgi:hypothetical protein
MKDAQDIEQLSSLLQKDLAIAYRERMAWLGWKHKSN